MIFPILNSVLFFCGRKDDSFETSLMSHTILYKKTFISNCGREDASCQSLAGEEGAKGTSCRRQRAAHLPRKYPTFAKSRLKYCWSTDFIDFIG